MRRIDAVIAVVALAFAAFVMGAVLQTQRSRSQTGEAPAAVAPSGAGETPSNQIVVEASGPPPPVRDIPAILRTLQHRAEGTYVDELLAARDSGIARWADRRSNPVRVWIDEQPPLAGFDPLLPAEVRRAFDAWRVAGVPVVYRYVSDSARAEVRVTFVDRFDGRMSGRTLWERDPSWWIVGGTVELALRSGSGQMLTPPQFFAIALHEAGHLLGLDHTADTTAVMASRVRVLALSDRDIATMRLIYELPPGKVGGAGMATASPASPSASRPREPR
jgi:hypothetical protein